jgi:hypothetical protein
MALHIERGCWRLTLVVSVVLGLFGGWMSFQNVSHKYAQARRSAEVSTRPTPTTAATAEPDLMQEYLRLKAKHARQAQDTADCEKMLRTPVPPG